MLAWCCALALAGGDWRERPADVRADAVVSLTPGEVTSLFADPERASVLFPDDCTARWAHGVPRSGVGAVARVTWTPSWIYRRLTLTVERVDEGRRVRWDHAGPRGFVLDVEVAAEGAGSRVTLHTPLNPPGWPVAKLFHQQIVPAWTSCYAEALRRLEGP